MRWLLISNQFSSLSSKDETRTSSFLTRSEHTSLRPDQNPHRTAFFLVCGATGTFQPGSSVCSLETSLEVQHRVCQLSSSEPRGRQKQFYGFFCCCCSSTVCVLALLICNSRTEGSLSFFFFLVSPPTLGGFSCVIVNLFVTRHKRGVRMCTERTFVVDMTRQKEGDARARRCLCCATQVPQTPPVLIPASAGC